ncbi:MAG: hypothetical protein K1000chlam2_01512 [Chlamydiae bacterium]|nr:hypothetical protein [Chlamydiota bacterium]
MQEVGMREGNFTLSGSFERPSEQNQESFLWTATKVVGFIGLLVATNYASYWTGAHQAAQAGGKVYEETLTNLMNHISVEEIIESASGIVPFSAVALAITDVGSLAKAFTEQVYAQTPGIDLDITGPIIKPLVSKVEAVAENTIWWTKAAVATFLTAKVIPVLAPIGRFIAKRP